MNLNLKKTIILLVIGFFVVTSAYPLYTLGKPIPREETIQNRVPGVKAGDWATYDLAINYSTTDPKPPISPPPEWWLDIECYKIQVQSVNGTIIKFEVIIIFKNSTQVSNLMSMNISSPTMGSPFFIAANLSAGDPLYPNPSQSEIEGVIKQLQIMEPNQTNPPQPSPFSPVINATFMRTYASVEREVNYIQMQSDTSPAGYQAHNYMEMYWDRKTGILAELLQTMQFEKIPEHYLTYVAIRLLMRETNLWSPTVTAEVVFKPEVLNLKSRGEWIICHIKLPEGYKIKDINVSTLMLNGTVAAEETKPKTFGAHELIVKFDREAVIDLISRSLHFNHWCRFKKVTLTITGKLYDGTLLEGSDTIRIILHMHRRLGIRAIPI